MEGLEDIEQRKEADSYTNNNDSAVCCYDFHNGCKTVIGKLLPGINHTAGQLYSIYTYEFYRRRVGRNSKNFFAKIK